MINSSFFTVFSIFELRCVIHFSMIATADLERNIKIKHRSIYNQLHIISPIISISNKLIEFPHVHYLDFQNKTYKMDIFNRYTILPSFIDGNYSL